MSVAIVVAGLSACAQPSIKSDPDTADATNGIVYSLPRGLVKVTVSWDGSKPPSITFAEPIFEPDPAERFILRADHSIWANDKFTFGMANGLLTTVTSSNEDQTRVALKKLVELGAEVAKLVGRRTVGTLQPTGPFSKTLLFDPYDPSSVAGLQEALGEIGFEVEVSDADGQPLPLRAAPGCDHSLCFRTLAPVSVKIAGGASTSFRGIVTGARILIPDASQTYFYDVRRAACVKRVTELTLKNGVLTQTKITDPSEVVGCLNIPLDVLKAIVAVPGELLKYRTDNLTAETSLLKARVSLIEARQALSDAQTPPAAE